MAAYITYTPDVQTESNAGNLFDEIRHHISDVFFLIHYFSQVSGLNCNLWNEENQSQVCFSNRIWKKKTLHYFVHSVTYHCYLYNMLFYDQQISNLF